MLTIETDNGDVIGPFPSMRSANKFQGIYGEVTGNESRIRKMEVRDVEEFYDMEDMVGPVDVFKDLIEGMKEGNDIDGPESELARFQTGSVYWLLHDWIEGYWDEV